MHPPLIKQWTLPSVADLHAATLRLLGLLVSQRIESDFNCRKASMPGLRSWARDIPPLRCWMKQQVICSGLSPDQMLNVGDLLNEERIWLFCMPTNATAHKAIISARPYPPRPWSSCWSTTSG